MKHSISSMESPFSSPLTESHALPSPPELSSSIASLTPKSAIHRSSSQVSFNAQSTHSPYFPVPGYTPKVSFDTFENPAASMFSFTLSSKSDGYKRSRSTRVFLCASSPDESGREALDWALESFVQDGDEFVVFRGVEEDVLDKDHDIVREDARALMGYVQAKSQEFDSDRKLSIILEYIAGKVTDTLDRLIALYRPDSVVVGTRGRRAWQVGIGKGTMGSVSRYCLTHSPVPIIVVRPERKVKKTIEKRKADPKRGTHFD
jgi:nucleotide-binding universal stress UspA family protein